jgi:hypothetical protein
MGITALAMRPPHGCETWDNRFTFRCSFRGEIAAHVDMLNFDFMASQGRFEQVAA